MSDELTMRRRGGGARPHGSRRRSAVDRRLRPGRESLEDRLAPAAGSGLGAAAFVQQGKLTGAAVDLSYFGSSASMNAAGDVLIVGAQGQQFGPNNGQGLAYVFTRTGSSWTQAAVLSASDAAAGDAFGTSVAISLDGATAVVGAPDAGGKAGAVYVFSASGGAWTQTAKVAATGGAAGDLFGSSVSVAAAGGEFVVGAPDAAVGGKAGQGAAYVFTGGGSSWTQAAKLVAPDGAAGDGFGSSVSLSGDGGTVAAGAPDAGGKLGAAYVFTGGGSSWTGVRLAAPGLTAGRLFGTSVAASYDGGLVLAGAPGNLQMQGVAYVFPKSAGAWSPPSALAAGDGAVGDSFGASVALSADGRTALVGSPLTPIGSNANQGAAYVFGSSGGVWGQTAKLAADDGAAFDLLGSAVALNADGRFAAAGAPRNSPALHSLVGAAYVYGDTSPVVVTSGPTDRTAVAGSSTTFSASASGASPVGVQWQISTDGGGSFTNIAGANQTWYTLTPVVGDSGNLYRAYFFGADGSSAPTTAAKLTVAPQASILTIASSANPRPIAGSLSVTVGVAPASGLGAPPTGQVNLYINSTLFGSATLADGKAVFNIPAQAAGSYQLGATYNGDSTFNWSQATSTQIVSSKGTSSLAGVVPTSAVAGQPVPISGALTYSGAPQAPNGNIMVMQDGQPIFYAPTTQGSGTLSMSYTIPSLTAGTHGIRLIYLGSQGAAAAASPIYTVNVSAAASSAPVSSSSSPSSSPISGPVNHAATSAVTVTINPSSQTVAAGSLTTFTAAAFGAGLLGVQWQGSVDGGATFADIAGATQTSLTVAPPLAASGFQYRAVFTNYLGSSATTSAATLTVVRQSTILTASSSANPIIPTSNTFNVSVDVAAANGGGTPTGQVSLYFGSAFYKSANVVNGKAVFTIPVLDLSSNRIGVTYSGDGAYNWSQTVLSQFVTQGGTTLTGAVPTSAVAGQPVPISGSMAYTGTTIPPFGGVVVMQDGNPISYIQLATAGGSTGMNYTIPSLSAGTHSIRLIYLGCPVAMAAASPIYTVNVSAARAVAPAPSLATASSASSVAPLAVDPAPRAAGVPPTVAAAAPRASAALALQGRYSVAYKMRTRGPAGTLIP